MRAVFSYCGKPFERWVDGRSTRAFGWLDLQGHQFAVAIGARLLGGCDVPDLILFRQRYPGVQTVTFHAGFASAPGRLLVWAGAQLARLGVLRSLFPLVKQWNASSATRAPYSLP